MGGTPDIVGSDLFDEPGYIDTGRATFGAGSIITEKAAVGLYQRRIPRGERRMDVAEVLLVLFGC